MAINTLFRVEFSWVRSGRKNSSTSIGHPPGPML
jgi:hypothetical protein